MVDVSADLVEELLQHSGVTNLVDTRVFAGVVPRGTSLPFIWIQRRAVGDSGAMEAEDEPLSESFDVECVSADGREAIEISDAVRAWAKSWSESRSSSMGDHTYTWVSVQDAADDYTPRNTDAAEYLFISSLDVEVIRP